MKAYKAWDNASIESYSTIVFAENSREAKVAPLAGGVD